MTRSGKEYINGLGDGRRVFIDGTVVSDVADHPAFRGVVESIARIYDFVHAPENEATLTFTSPTTGKPANLAFLIPRSEDDLRRRRIALRAIAEQSFGLLGRGPEHVAGFLAGWASRRDVFDPRGAENISRFFARVRDEDLYCTYAIVPPQIDRRRPAHQQAEPFLYAGVRERRPDGVVLRGAQQLATGAAIADYIILSCIVPLIPGDDDFANSVAIPVDAEGVKIYSRRSYASGAPSVFDYPMSSRFDEVDALIVLDDVFVPWENVFVYRDISRISAQWNDTPAHLLGNNQAQIRLSVKLDFLAGLAQRVVAMNGIDGFPQVRGTLGEIAALASAAAGLVYGQEQNCEIDDHGIAWPARAECFAMMTLQTEFYPRVLNLVRTLCGAGLIQLPSSAAEFAHLEAAEDLGRYVQSPGTSAQERVKLMKLVWDLVGSEFAGRHEQYEMFYAGAPFLVKARMAQAYDFHRAGQLVQRALSEYTLPPAAH